jgi:hypothetical protein
MKNGRGDMKNGFWTVLLIAVTAWAVTAPAQESQSGGQDPGVAHLSLVHGDVSMQRGDSGDWVATTLNTPIVRGDTVATGARSRAEVQLDYATILRLAAQSQVKIADLSRSHVQLQVSEGYANVTMFKGSEAEVEVNTPNVSVRPLKNGRYRVEVNSDSETNVIVREGEAQITTSQGSTTVRQGEIITIRGTEDPEYKVEEASGADDWDNWNRDRDNIIRNAESVRRTSPYYTGAHDLDAYGRWANVPGYGWVWAPYEQPVTWAPYQAGRWVWEPYYGWTWVSYEPWGWAPYHYGRWFFYDSSWYWWPGPVTPIYRPVWSPAFVFFLGFGHHVNFGFGFSSIGWCPVAPFETFYPWWGRGFNRINVVNITNITVINHGGFRGREFSNVNLALTSARVRAGITSVSAENFGRSNARFERGVDVATLRRAQVATGNLGVVPTRESLAVSNRGFSSAPSGIRSGAGPHFFTQTRTPATPSFQDHVKRMQQVIRANGGAGQTTVGLGANTFASSRFGRTGLDGVATTMNSRAGGLKGSAADTRSGWHGFSREQDSLSQHGNARNIDSSRYGSHRFGDQGSVNRGNTDRRFTSPSGRSGGISEDRGRFSDRPSGLSVNGTPVDRGGSSTTQDRSGWRGMSTGSSSAPQNRVGTRVDRSGGWGAVAPSTPQNQRDIRIDRGGSNGGWQRGGSQANDSKPPLELSKPIVVPRGDSGGGRGYGGYSGRVGYSGGGQPSGLSGGGRSGGNYGGGGRNPGGSSSAGHSNSGGGGGGRGPGGRGR